MTESPLCPSHLSLYYVASVDAYVNFTLAGDFAAYPVTLENLTAAESDRAGRDARRLRRAAMNLDAA